MIKIVQNYKIADNFTADELANHLSDGTYLVLDRALPGPLQAIRDIVGSTRITSGYRTVDFNRSIGGSSNSNHLTGKAVDLVFDFTDWNINSIKKVFSGCGFTNIGIYIDKKTNKFKWIHADVGKCWNEANGWKHFNNSAVKIYYK